MTQPFIKRPAVKGVLFFTVLALLEIFFFRTALNGVSMFGDAGDGRFNNFICEAWFQFFSGNAGFNELPTFYPVSDTLAYSDIMLGFGIPYSVLRFIGFDLFLANKLTIMAVHFFGTLTIFYLFYYKLRFSCGASFVGTILGMMSSAVCVMFTHVQLIFIGAIPLLCIFLVGFFEHANEKARKWLPYAIGFCLWFGLILLTAFYVAYFVVLIGGCMALFYLFLQAKRKQHPFRAIGTFLRTQWKALLVCAPCCTLWIVPFFLLYLPVLGRYGGRDFANVAEFLPHWFDFINTPASNGGTGGWGASLLGSIRPGYNSRAYASELWHGFTPFVAFVLIAAAVWLVIRFFLARKRGEARSPLFVLSLSAVLTVFLLFLLMMTDGMFSLWYLVFKYVPGASALRAVSRMVGFLGLPAALAIAYVFDLLLRRMARFTKAGSYRHLAVAAVLCLVLLWDNNTPIYADWNRPEQLQFLQAVPPPPAACRVMYVIYSENKEIPGHMGQHDAWAIALDKGLKTVNGNSGQFPPGWDFYFVSQPEYESRVLIWAKNQKIDIDTLYAYDVDTQSWYSAVEAAVSEKS